MRNIIHFLISNKEWLFSGVGLLFLTCIIKLIKKIKLNHTKITIRYFLNSIKSLFSKKTKRNDDSVFISENPSDGITIPINKVFTKSWTVQNIGDVVWKNRCLKCVEYAGQSFYPLEDKIKIPRVYPGQSVTLTVKYCVNVEGDYRSRWKMCDENGNLIYPEKHIGVGVNVQARDTYQKRFVK